MKITLYVPDDLHAQMQRALAHVNWSALVQAAFRAQLAKVRALQYSHPPRNEDR